jgi:AhpD family alkylhydroperoxidase
MNRLEEISRKRRRAHDKLLSHKSKVYEAFLEMEKATYSDRALPKKIKELIAVGISVAIDCESCMQWHIGQAAKAGASAQEVLEAVEVGMEMGGAIRSNDMCFRAVSPARGNVTSDLKLRIRIDP